MGGGRQCVGGSVWSVLGALLLVAACTEQSRVAPDAAIVVSGEVHGTDGAPLADRPVQLGSGVTDLEGGAAVLTVGLFCTGGDCTGDVFDATTGDDGAYRLELTGRDTQSAFGEATSFQLVTSGPPDGEHPTGAAVTARFRIQTTELAMPVLRLVDPDLTLGTESSAVVATWDGGAAPGPYELTFGGAEGKVVWSVTAAEGTVRLDPRLLEDTTGVALVAGGSTDAIEGGDVDIQWRSPGVAYRGGAGAPPSRGASCSVVASDGSSEPLDRCPSTDGDFAPAGVPLVVCPAAGAEDPAACGDVERLRVELPTSVPADLVVVRGCASCRVTTVDEGGGVVDAGPIAAHGTVALDGRPVTAVELTGDLDELAEVSVWTPLPEGTVPLASVDDPEKAAGALADGTGGGGGNGWWPWFVGGLALAAAVGVGIALGRRTRP